MLIFIDESGDPGLKIRQGSSEHFIVSLIVFKDEEEATACDTRITLLRKELGWSADGEFHFHRNSNRVREVFLKSVEPYSFFYYGIIVNKGRLPGMNLKNKASFYKYACHLVFENAKSKLHEATVIIDHSGSNDFRNQLGSYLKRQMNNRERRLIKKVKMQNSKSNNLLQLADYVSGVISRSIQQKNRSAAFRTMIAHREIFVETWPK